MMACRVLSENFGHGLNATTAVVPWEVALDGDWRVNATDLCKSAVG